MANKL